MTGYTVTHLHSLQSVHSNIPILFGASGNCRLLTACVIKVKVKVTLRLTVSQSVSFGVEPPYLLLFDSYGLDFCGAPSLTRGRVCLLYMLLALASADFLGSESLGTRDHILLSQIWDFPFRRLLRLCLGCRAEQSRAVAYCRQPASTVTLGIEPRWVPWPYICSVSRLLFFLLLSLFLPW
jgi:hypothetical protein